MLNSQHLRMKVKVCFRTGGMFSFFSQLPWPKSEVWFCLLFIMSSEHRQSWTINILECLTHFWISIYCRKFFYDVIILNCRVNSVRTQKWPIMPLSYIFIFHVNGGCVVSLWRFDHSICKRFSLAIFGLFDRYLYFLTTFTTNTEITLGRERKACSENLFTTSELKERLV